MNQGKHILLLGAGKSATVLIDYLKQVSIEEKWQVTIADINLAVIEEKVGNHDYVKPIVLNIEDENERRKIIESSDLVISLLPPTLHFLVALDCLLFGKHLLTASYVDDRISVLSEEIKKKGILFLCEMGLDPGIDHMSAMQIVHRIQKEGGIIRSFVSHCGGLVAPESDDNPWHYKISWNPKNVVLAGKAGAVYRENQLVKNQNYDRLFNNCHEVYIEGIGKLAYYPNRDSLSYIPIYAFAEVETFMRTTLRHPDFCVGWNMLIDLGLTDETEMQNTNGLTIADFLQNQFLKKNISTDFTNEIVKKQFLFLGLNDETVINKGVCSHANILQYIIEKKWVLQKTDRDMIVMLHEIGYSKTTSSHTSKFTVKSSLVVKGTDSMHTAMAKTVGLPLGIAAKFILKGEIVNTGLHIPIIASIYEPVLNELKKYGIIFAETEK